MAIRITRTLMLHLVVTAEEEVRHRVPLFEGQRLVVHPVYEEEDGYDWLAPLGGGVMPLPPDAWEVAVA